MRKKDTSLFDENRGIRPTVYFKCYEDAIIEIYGSVKNYEDYLYNMKIFINSLPELPQPNKERKR